MVPHALFPLMTYFLWIRLSVYNSYIALYIAGKTIAVVSIISWYIFSVPAFPKADSMVTSLIMKRPDVLIAGASLIMAALDALSIFGGLAIKHKLKHLETQIPK
jgi:hypothetical protein